MPLEAVVVVALSMSTLIFPVWVKFNECIKL